MRKTRDPIERAKKYLTDLELATVAELKEIEVAARQEVEEAVEAAKAAPQPDPALLYEDIYCDQSPNFFMRGCDMTVSHGVYGTTK